MQLSALSEKKWLITSVVSLVLSVATLAVYLACTAAGVNCIDA